jgi:hypothetical protein
MYAINGEPLWLSGKVVKNEKINEIERTRVRSPPRATSFFKKCMQLMPLMYCVPTYIVLISTISQRFSLLCKGTFKQWLHTKAVKPFCHGKQGCQMGYFQTKNPNLGQFWWDLHLEDVGMFYSHLVCFTATWYISSFGVFYGNLVHFCSVLVCCTK